MHDAAAILFKEGVETDKDHRVYLRGADGNVKKFLHKQAVDTLRHIGAVNESGMVDIDTGALVFGADTLKSLRGLVSTEDMLDEEKYKAFVKDMVRLSLHGDFHYPLAVDSVLEQFCKQRSVV